MSRNFPGLRWGRKELRGEGIPGKGNGTSKGTKQRNDPHVDGKPLNTIGTESLAKRAVKEEFAKVAKVKPCSLMRKTW